MKNVMSLSRWVLRWIF